MSRTTIEVLEELRRECWPRYDEEEALDEAMLAIATNEAFQEERKNLQEELKRSESWRDDYKLRWEQSEARVQRLVKECTELQDDIDARDRLTTF